MLILRTDFSTCLFSIRDLRKVAASKNGSRDLQSLKRGIGAKQEVSPQVHQRFGQTKQSPLLCLPRRRMYSTKTRSTFCGIDRKTLSEEWCVLGGNLWQDSLRLHSRPCACKPEVDHRCVEFYWTCCFLKLLVWNLYHPISPQLMTFRHKVLECCIFAWWAKGCRSPTEAFGKRKAQYLQDIRVQCKLLYIHWSLPCRTMSGPGWLRRLEVFHGFSFFIQNLAQHPLTLCYTLAPGKVRCAFAMLGLRQTLPKYWAGSQVMWNAPQGQAYSDGRNRFFGEMGRP